MDAWDSNFREPTEDEKSARRVLALAIALINARRPLSSTELHREFYPTMEDDAFRKAFLRDRRRLLVAGLALQQGPQIDGVATWIVDDESSFVKENLLSEEDALVLDALLLPLASDPSYPYARDLRLALAKIDRSFDGTSTVAIPPEARRRNNNISRLEDCMTARHAARITYRRANGSKTDRVVAPLGLFFLNGRTYMVAAAIGEDGGLGEAHTYNLNRVATVREQTRTTFVRPADFDVRDYVLLPFQMGPELYQADFATRTGEVLHERVCNQSMAVSWAIAEDVRPLGPPELVEAWQKALEVAARGASCE